MRRFGGRRTLPAPAVALALAVLAPLQGAAQQRYAVPVPTAARPPALPADASAPAVCATVSQCILFPASRVDLVAPAIRAELVAPAYVCADPALAAPPTRALVCPAVRVPPVRASTYPGVAVWSFAGATVGAVALAATGYALGLLGDAGYDSWLTPSDALATLGFVVGYRPAARSAPSSVPAAPACGHTPARSCSSRTWAPRRGCWSARASAGPSPPRVCRRSSPSSCTSGSRPLRRTRAGAEAAPAG